MTINNIIIKIIIIIYNIIITVLYIIIITITIFIIVIIVIIILFKNYIIIILESWHDHCSGSYLPDSITITFNGSKHEITKPASN